MRKLLVMNVIGHVIYIYIGIFVNLFIWEESKRIFDVSWYNFFMFFTWAFGFTLGAHLLTRHSIRLVYALSAGSGLAVFTLLTFLRLEERLVWIAVIGASVGLTFGLFYAAQNLSLSLSGKAKEFGPFFSIANAMLQVSSVTVPILSALVIEQFGYSGSFLMMFGIVGCMLAASLFVPNLSLAGVREQEGEWYEGIGYFRLFDTPAAKWLQAAFTAAGFFFQFQNLFVLIFTFHVSEDKLMIALLNSGYTLSTFAALYAYRKIMLGEDAWMFFGSSLLACGFLVSLLPHSSLLVLSNLLSVVGMYYFSVQWSVKVFRSVNSMPPMRKLRVLIWRECTLCAARCAMLVCLFFLDDIRGAWFAILIALTILSMFAVPVCFRQSAKRSRPSAVVPAGTQQAETHHA